MTRTRFFNAVPGWRILGCFGAGLALATAAEWGAKPWPRLGYALIAGLGVLLVVVFATWAVGDFDTAEPHS